VLSGYVHALVVRTFAQRTLETLAQSGTIPVINALTDESHPCQILADLMTVMERRDCDLSGLRQLAFAWIGDGNNVANSWIEAAGILGLDLRLASPDGYDPDPEVLRWACERGRIRCTREPAEAARGANVVCTDVWASMGQESDAENRRAAFSGYQVSAQLMRLAHPDAVFLHCLPAHRGEEVAAEVIDGPCSAVIDQAHNRLHTQKALLELLLAS
jgi:ornithine carbamoyltransferase